MLINHCHLSLFGFQFTYSVYSSFVPLVKTGILLSFAGHALMFEGRTGSSIIPRRRWYILRNVGVDIFALFVDRRRRCSCLKPRSYGLKFWFTNTHTHKFRESQTNSKILYRPFGLPLVPWPSSNPRATFSSALLRHPPSWFSTLRISWPFYRFTAYGIGSRDSRRNYDGVPVVNNLITV